MDQQQKHFALQLGALISLYVSLTAFIVLSFSVINLGLPDDIEGLWQRESAMSSIRFSIATLVVFFPAYIYLVRVVNTLRRTHTGDYIPVVKWLLYISLLVGALILLGNFVTIIYTFLNGELTLRFLLKAVTLFLIIGVAFLYYYLDVKDYWRSHEKQSIYYGVGISAVLLISVGIGISLIQSPGMIREMRLDQRQVEDLRKVQWRIEEALNINGALADSLEEYYDTSSIPEAPESREAYTYERTEDGFKLCATFAHPSQTDNYMTRPFYEVNRASILNPDNWEHGEGRYCFERVVRTAEQMPNGSQIQEKFPPPIEL